MNHVVSRSPPYVAHIADSPHLANVGKCGVAWASVAVATSLNSTLVASPCATDVSEVAGADQLTGAQWQADGDGVALGQGGGRVDWMGAMRSREMDG